MTLIYFFPGQGSQSVGMGRDLFEKFPDKVQQADEILGYSIKELCLTDSDKQLNLTQYTQPALFIVSALAFLEKQEEGSALDATAGHSLGEYNALFAAEVFDFATGVKLVKKRGELMGEQSGGGMSAVIGLSSDMIENVFRDEGFTEIDVANYNSPQQTVISGLLDDLTAVQPKLEAAGARMVLPLKVSAPFHSRYMKSASEEFSTFLDQFTFSAPKISVVANVSAKPYVADEVKQNLTQQIYSSVKWVDTVRYLLNLPNPEWEEVGPGKVLTGLVRQIQAG